MAGAGKKTFTAGETLTASDVNTYLMEQSVMVFGGTAARASAIPTPSTGMTSYIGVTGTATIPQLETYTGSAWQTPYGLTLVANASFSAASNITIDNVFSALYRNYSLFIDFTASTGLSVNAQLRNTVPATLNTNYGNQRIVAASTGLTAARNTATTTFTVVGAHSATPQNARLNISSPFLAQATTFSADGIYTPSTAAIEYVPNVGVQSDATSCQGIVITTSTGNITGSLRIYGYRDA
jgi:hypothetical protein